MSSTRITPLIPESPFIGYAGIGGVHADQDLIFVADESGNSGANYLDRAQPCYVAAGWLLRRSDQSRARHVTHKILRATRMSELSGVQMLKTTRGRSAAISLISSLLSFASPLIVVVEKRFALGAVLAQELLHPGMAAQPPQLDRSATRAHAHILASLPEDVLELASRFTKRPAHDEAAALLPHMIQALKDGGELHLAAAVRNVERELHNSLPRLDATRARGLAPNILGFTTLLQMLEIFGLQSSQRIALIHDHAHQFADAYTFYQALAANPLVTATAREFFEAAGVPGLVRHVTAPLFRDSKAEALIQAADLLSGTVNFLVKRLWQSGAWADDELKLSLLTLAGFFNPDLRKFFVFVGSDERGKQTGDAVVAALAKLVPSDNPETTT